MNFTLPAIYPITDKNLARRANHLSILKELVRGGARIVQIRDKTTPVRQLYEDLLKCADFAASRGVMLVINDRCDLALSCGTAGVHLGQEDLPPDIARKILPCGSIIGVSAHSIGQVRRAQPMPVEYLGFGPIYPTSTKKDAARAVGLRALKAACKASSLPVVAIGGIGLSRLREVLDAGAASAAVISALMEAKDIAREMSRFLEAAREK